MKVLDAGDHPLSNADVLDWVQRKRAQHASEDAQAHAVGAKHGDVASSRPKNFLRMLDRTERELSSDKYPYAKNPSAYRGDANRTRAFHAFVLDAEHVIHHALQHEWRPRFLQAPTDAERELVDRELERVQDMKCLTEPEMLMIYNHAPTCVEMLQPLLENVEERFTAEEQQMLVDVVVRTLRPDETKSGG